MECDARRTESADGRGRSSITPEPVLSAFIGAIYSGEVRSAQPSLVKLFSAETRIFTK
jgi:hypothetical protein